ncbi:MAG: spore maturation protein, partial [Oscillospiraceae bacterium]|nr:spore maturation protein [Oscillospiraceae bacterium]
MKILTALLLLLGAVLGLRCRVPLVSVLGEGIGEGLRTVLRMFPPAAAILAAAAMLRASGAL